MGKPSVAGVTPCSFPALLSLCCPEQPAAELDVWLQIQAHTASKSLHARAAVMAELMVGAGNCFIRWVRQAVLLVILSFWGVCRQVLHLATSHTLTGMECTA